MTRLTYKKPKGSHISKSMFRKTRSKRQRGGNHHTKLAIMLITSHGNLDAIEEQYEHDEDINVYKINATTPGVCNFILDDELLNMGKSISDIVKERKTGWLNNGMLNSSHQIDLDFKSPAIGQQQISYLAKTLRTYLKTRDPIHKEASKAKALRLAKKTVPKSEYFIEGDDDPDIEIYNEQIDKGYNMHVWKKGQSYLNKTYTIIPEERIETGDNPYNNTVLLLGEAGIPELDLVNMPYGLRSHKEKDNAQFSLSEIFKKLTNMGYTDTIIIDLSCAAGWDERHRRRLMLATKKGDVVKYGGKWKMEKRTIRKLRKTKKTRKTNKTKKTKKQKGGSSTVITGGKFVPSRNIKNDKCSICQDDLQSSEVIIDKGIVYELTCGHQFHSNCLNEWCAINTKKAKAEYKQYNEKEYLRPSANFKCPVCNQTTLNEENDCTALDAYEDDYIHNQYKSEEYKGIKPQKKNCKIT